jgi:hypothetical protein
LPHWKKFDRNIISGDTVLNRVFKEFIQSLNDNQVRYLVVGGYAVALHGYPRYTKDIIYAPAAVLGGVFGEILRWGPRRECSRKKIDWKTQGCFAKNARKDIRVRG